MRSEEKKYYAQAIAANIQRNGSCICDECNREIVYPSGRNVSHIISKGANKALYLHPTNNFILCFVCEDIWTCRDKTKMSIYPRSEEIKDQITQEYYDSSK